ncbi:ABC transporter ATP-binding protein [Streptomyces sp. SM11]|uniref:ABC transporter ATP-binding protein n=1 Tax=Streptomyces sp. SM11 TaxID=565557 RepID=UPI000CD4B983|nr:ABC transporter ATP-binding protein [Streptomyces sp. SM11]
MITTLQSLIDACGTRAPLMKQALVMSVLSSMAQGLAYGLLIPLFFAMVSGSGDAWGWLSMIAALVLVDAGLRFSGSRIEWRIHMEVADETRTRLGEQLKRIPLQQLLRRDTGDLNNVLTGNVNDVVSVAGGLFGIVINSIVAPFAAAIVLLCFDWRLALCMAVLFPLAIPLYRLMRNRAAHENRVSAAAYADTSSQLIEYAQGVAVLRATRQVGAQSKRLQRSLTRLREAQMHSTRLGTMPSIAMSAIVQIGILGITAFSVLLAFDEPAAVPVALGIIVASIRFSEPLAQFASMSQMFDFMQAAVDRIQALSSLEPLPVLAGGGPPTSSEITFEGVTFAYDRAGEQALTDVSLVAPPRSLTALVGSSGSGKTTITRLLTRFADPQSGRVTVGGTDIRTLSQEALMARFSVVFQDVYLFDDSIRANIRLAKADATEQEIIDAAMAANCHDFISALPNGYDTKVGESGGSLSGGERQRISIARAILKDAPIVILDEPTSALDTESEVAVQRAIDRLVRDKTVVVIAHRLSTIAAADQILLLNEGRVVERGTHLDLLARNGRYAEMWNAQLADRHWRISAAP